MKLEKTLKTRDVFAFAAGAMISSGIFVLPGLAFAVTGPSAFLAYFIAAILYLPALFAQAELATAMPRAGGTYFFVERSLGAYAGTMAGIANWFSIAFKTAFACVGLGALAGLAFPEYQYAVQAGAAIACLLFTFINFISTEGSGLLQSLLVAALLLVLVMFIVFAIPKVDKTSFTPLFASGYLDFIAVIGMVFVSFGGVTNAVDVAEEVKDPTSALPKGMFYAFGLVSLLYVATVACLVGVLPANVLSGNLSPLADGGRVVAGAPGEYLIIFAAFLAYATTGNAGLLAASRSPVSMSRDGLLPEFLAKTNKKTGTPQWSLLLTAALIISVVVFLDVENLVKVASTMFLISFLLSNIAVIVLRQSNIVGYRPSFRVPLYPFMPVLAIGVYGFLVIDMGVLPIEVALGFVAVTGIWYWFYVHSRIERESAALFLVKKALSRHMPRNGLEDELVSIVLERDEVQADRFDELVSQCPIVDLAEGSDKEKVFQELSKKLSEKLAEDSQKLVDLFHEREEISSTAIVPGLAIPHIILPGENKFALAIARSKEGLVYTEGASKVHAVFALLGSEDQRHFHLKALVAIAHIVQQKDFEEQWQSLRNNEQIRDFLLLSSRKRSD